MARVSDKRWRRKKKNSTREIPPSAELNSLSLLPCWQCNICVGVQQLSLAVCSYRHHAFSVRMYACLYPPTPNYTCQTPRDLAQEETFFFLYLPLFIIPTLAPCRRNAAFRSLSHPISHIPLIHLPPLCSVSLPPTPHHLLRPIITRSTGPLQLPWQQLCWAQVPVSPACHWPSTSTASK